jgi:UDP-N-acetylglucosamine 2-epimerase (non-hydrolysing)
MDLLARLMIWSLEDNNMKCQNSKIAIIIGTRAELIKTFPLMRELDLRGISYSFIHSGQHNLGDFCDLFGVKRPDFVLTKEHDKSSRFNSSQLKAILWNISLVFKVRRVLKGMKQLSYVVYHGDTMTTASASIGSSKLFNPFKRYKGVHLEAGLRSFNNFEPFPEEIARRVAGRFSDILLAVSDKAKKNLDGYRKKEVFLVGNTVIDSAYFALELARKKKVKSLCEKDFCLVTVHRHENLKSYERMKRIVEILCSVKIPTYFAMHDNTKKKLEDFGLLKELKKNKNIHLIEPLDYVNFIFQMSECSLIICDGGSMQEESLIFGKPCIILRNATERPEGLDTNFQFLSKLDVEKTKEKINEYLSNNFKTQKYKNPYGEKGLTKKIVEILR